MGTNEIAYAAVAAIKLDSGGIAAGVNVSRFIREGDRPHYEPIHVLSLWYEDAVSITQTLPIIVSDTVECVDSKYIQFQSGLPQFIKTRKLKEQTAMCAMKYGVQFRFVYRPMLELHFPEIMTLANDAIRRGYSLTCEI